MRNYQKRDKIATALAWSVIIYTIVATVIIITLTINNLDQQKRIEELEKTTETYRTQELCTLEVMDCEEDFQEPLHQEK